MKRTCTICRYCEKYIIPCEHLRYCGKFYVCRLLDKIIRHPKIKGTFCEWFFLNDLCSKALEEKRGLSLI